MGPSWLRALGRLSSRPAGPTFTARWPRGPGAKRTREALNSRNSHIGSGFFALFMVYSLRAYRGASTLLESVSVRGGAGANGHGPRPICVRADVSATALCFSAEPYPL